MCLATGEVHVTVSRLEKRDTKEKVDSGCRAAGDKGRVPLPSMQAAVWKATAQHSHQGFPGPVWAPAPCSGTPCKRLTTSSMPAHTKGSVALHTQGTDL